jgi:phage portal protein BeeE
MLLAIPGDNTYSNYQEANRVFWRQSVLPLAARIGCSLTHCLAPAFGILPQCVRLFEQTLALGGDRWRNLNPRRTHFLFLK